MSFKSKENIRTCSFACESAFFDTAVKYKEPTYTLKKFGTDLTAGLDSDNCHRNVTISCLLSRSYPVKTDP